MVDEKIKGSLGGKARARALSSEKRIEIAKKAAVARWGDRPKQATHKGNFKDEFGIDVECYVLNDEIKTAVVSKRGMGVALGLGNSGSRLTEFVGRAKIAPYLGRELRDKIENPIIFQSPSAGGNSPPPTPVHGHDVTVLIDLCNAIVQAASDGSFGSRKTNVAKQAQIILNASAKAGIKGLVYALAGYDPETQEVINAFKLYVLEEAKKYEPEFPNELYVQWHRLYGIEVPQRGKPWQFRHLTIKHVYYPLAQSNGKIYELVKALKARDGDRQKRLFQFLTDVGARALRIHMGRILEMCESSAGKDDYEDKVKKRFGEQQELNLVSEK